MIDGEVILQLSPGQEHSGITQPAPKQLPSTPCISSCDAMINRKGTTIYKKIANTAFCFRLPKRKFGIKIRLIFLGPNIGEIGFAHGEPANILFSHFSFCFSILFQVCEIQSKIFRGLAAQK